MKIHRLLFIAMTIFGLQQLSAQEYFELTEGEKQIIENFEVSYRANKRKTKKGWDQYDVRISVTNLGERILRILPEAGADGDEYDLLSVKFLNARPGLFRNSGGRLRPLAFKTSFKYSYPNCDYDPDDEDSEKYIEKEVTEIIGYGMRKSQTKSTTIGMSVREGERPQLEVALNQFYGSDWER